MTSKIECYLYKFRYYVYVVPISYKVPGMAWAVLETSLTRWHKRPCFAVLEEGALDALYVKVQPALETNTATDEGAPEVVHVDMLPSRGSKCKSNNRHRASCGVARESSNIL